MSLTVDEVRLPAGANVILCADDYGMSPGVSKGIEELALARRLSATSAIVTLPEWERSGQRLAGLRGFIAIGLHVNLTLGAPLGPVRTVAEDGELPSHPDLLRLAMLRRLDRAAIAAEIGRQLAHFEDATGFAPDFIDGHQHVHALPVVREALMEVLAARDLSPPPLVRDPGDSPMAMLLRRSSAPKAMAIALFSRGFGRRMRAAGYPTNHGFAGVSAFDLDSPYENELATFFRAPGRRHLVMCHPGYVDPELGGLDEVVERRHQELDTLFAIPRLDEAIWHVRRPADGGRIDWQEALPV